MVICFIKDQVLCGFDKRECGLTPCMALDQRANFSKVKQG